MLPRLDLIILFGSQATGKTNALSDVDIAVLSDHNLPFGEKSEVMDMIARDFNYNVDKIDLIDIGEAPPLLQMQIATHGKLLRGNPDAFLRFKVLAWKRYNDTARFRLLRKKYLAQIYG